jgi:PPP family 3-phenylpropionic acid transporter
LKHFEESSTMKDDEALLSSEQETSRRHDDLTEPLLAGEQQEQVQSQQQDVQVQSQQQDVQDSTEIPAAASHSPPLDEERALPSSPPQPHDDGDESSPPPPPPCPSRLLFFKTLYFLSGLSGATWGRFGVIFYNKIEHLSDEQIGILQGVMPLVGFLTMPFWGYVADRIIQSRKAVFLFCKGMATISLLSMAAVRSSFYGTLACAVGMAAFRSSGVLDAHTLDFLGDKHRDLYGTIRLWCAVSWGLGAVGMGWITDSFGFEWNFWLFATMMTIVLLVTWVGLPARSQSEQARYDALNNSNNNDDSDEALDNSNDNDVDIRPRISTLIQSICRIPVVLWLFEVAVIGAGMSLVDAFLFVYLQNELGAPTKLCGYTVGVTVLFELPIFHYSKSLLRYWGHDWLFLVAMSAYSIRVLGYTMLTPATVYWILPLEVLHGITFACMWIASIDFSARVAPPEWSTTFQSLLSMTMTCLGGSVGPIAGGYVMEHYGPVVLYRGTGILVGGVALVHSVFYFCFQQGHDAFLKRVEEGTARDEIIIS